MEIEQFITELEKELKVLHFVESWIVERKNTTVKFVVVLKESALLSVFYNKVLRIQSFALIVKENRVWGFDFDNRLGWHEHPLLNAEKHVPQAQQTISQIINKLNLVWQELLL